MSSIAYKCQVSLLYLKPSKVIESLLQEPGNSKNSNKGHSLKRADSSSFSGHHVQPKYQVSLLYLITKQSYRVVTSGTWELVPHSKNSNRGHSLKRAESSSFSGHEVASKYQVSLLYLIAKQSYRVESLLLYLVCLSNLLSR